MVSEQRSWPAHRCIGSELIRKGLKSGPFVEQGDFVLRDTPECAKPYPEHMPVGTVVRAKKGYGRSEPMRVLLPWVWDAYARCHVTIVADAVRGTALGTTHATTDWYEPIPQTETITVSGPPKAVAKIRAKAEAKGLKVGPE